jgi:hypothetical protein
MNRRQRDDEAAHEDPTTEAPEATLPSRTTRHEERYGPDIGDPSKLEM